RERAVTDEINKVMGRRVTLHYEEKVGLPTSCFGETLHYVTRVTLMEDFPLAPGLVVPQPAPQPAQPAKWGRSPIGDRRRDGYHRAVGEGPRQREARARRVGRRVEVGAEDVKGPPVSDREVRSEEHTSELQSHSDLV